MADYLWARQCANESPASGIAAERCAKETDRRIRAVKQPSGTWRPAFKLIAAIIACVGTTACGDGSEPEVVTIENELHRPLEATTLDLEVVLPNETTLESVALLAATELEIEREASVKDATGAGALVSNVGSVHTELERRSRTGTILSKAPILLNRGSTIEGDVTSEGTVTDRGANITGVVSERASVPTKIEMLDAVSVPAGGTEGIIVRPGEQSTLEPGAYRGVLASPGSTVTLSAGRYIFGALGLLPGSKLQIDDSEGPVFVYVVRRLWARGVIEDANEEPLAFLLGYFGEHEARIGGIFRGTLVAPNAPVEILPAAGPRPRHAHGHCSDSRRHERPLFRLHGGKHKSGGHDSDHEGGRHRGDRDGGHRGGSHDSAGRGADDKCPDIAHEGAFFAKRIELHQHADIVHVPFPWDTIRIGLEVTPVLTCIKTEGEGRFAAYLGYENASSAPVEIPVGFSNRISPDDFVIAQPTVFQPGTHTGFFVVPFDEQGLTWRLGGGSVHAAPDSTACTPLTPRPPPEDETEKFPPEPPEESPPSATYDETSSNPAPFVDLRVVERMEPVSTALSVEDESKTTEDPEVLPLIAEGRGTRAVEVVLANATGRVLTFQDGVVEGASTTRPPAFINPSLYGTWETENGRPLQGTGGFATYGDSRLSVTVRWNNPFIGGNDYTFSLEGPDAPLFTVDRIGGSGNRATVFFAVRPIATAATRCPFGSFQWVIDNLRAMEDPLSFVDTTLGFISTPAKRLTGVKNWATTGCFVPRVVGRVRQVAFSTDGFYTIDILLDEFGGVLMTGTNKAVRIEVDPTRGPGAINPATLAILNNGGPPAINQRIIVSGDVLIDHGSFLEVHPTTPIEIAPSCDGFPPGSAPLFCSTLLRNIFSIGPGAGSVLMGRSPNRACFLTRVSGSLTSSEAELSATIDDSTGNWVLSVTPGVLSTPFGDLPLPLEGQARCMAVNRVSAESIWSSGEPSVFLSSDDSTTDCYFTRVGGTWTTGGGAVIGSLAPIELGADINEPAPPGIRAGARCIDVRSATFPGFIWGPAPQPRVFMNPISEACLFKQIRGAFSGGTVEILPDTTTGSFLWTLGGTTSGAVAACATLAP